MRQKFNKAQGWQLWKENLGPEKNFYFLIFIYSSATSLLSLAIPISVQALVNTVTFAVLMQPLIVVSLLLLSLLVFSGVLMGLQDYATEYLQRHLYARNTASIAMKILDANPSSLKDLYSSDLVNRYFDIMTMQKKLAKLCVGGFSLMLQTIAGMLLLAFYHPYFLAFDIILVILLSLVWFFYGKGAMESAIKESKAKYKVGSWLEQLAQMNNLFKTTRGKEAAIKATDDNISNYLKYRSLHFNFLFRQIIFLLAIYAFLSALILGLGGFLVMEGQLTLGQLVAAEIVVAVILSGFAKAGSYLEAFYDLHAAIDKIADFNILTSEEDKGIKGFNYKDIDLKFENVSFRRQGFIYKFDQIFQQNKNYLIREDFDSTQRVFLSFLQGAIKPERGHIYLGSYDSTQISPLALREAICVIDEPYLFEGTIRENLSFGIEDISDADINEALDKVGLTAVLNNLPNKIETKVWPGTQFLCWGEMARLEIAKALLQKPAWIVISSLFHQLPASFRVEIVQMMKGSDVGLIVWTSGLTESDLGQFCEEVNISRELIITEEQR